MNEDGKQGETSVDVFGVERDTTGHIVPPPAPPAGEGEKDKDDKEDGDGKDKDDKGKKDDLDIENHPVVKQLKADLEKVKTDYGGNLSGQRDLIDELTGKLKKYEKGEQLEGANVYDPKEIKRVKDLPKEQQEEMTELEKTLFDQAADMKERINQIASKGVEKEQKENDAAEITRKAQERTSHVSKTIQAAAKALAADDVNVANQIIDAFNNLKFNTEGMSDEDIKARVETAAKTLSTYKAPSEQGAGGKGKPAGEGKAGTEVDTDAIVDEVAAGRGGKSFQL